MDNFSNQLTVNRLARNVLADAWTIRLFVALATVDLVFILLVAAKAFDLISFTRGIGNLIIAGQLAMVALVLVSAWRRCRTPALASLALVSSGLAAEKIFKFHNEVGVHLGHTVIPSAIDTSAATMIGVLGFAFFFGVIAASVLVIGWRRSDRQGRAALLLIAAGVAAMAATSISADVASFFMAHLTHVHHHTLSRLEQGLELITVSALLALTVGVVRVGYRNPPKKDNQLTGS
jgi:hypothetical protein